MTGYIKKLNADALLLFIEKVEELKSSQFFSFYFNISQQIQVKQEIKKVNNTWIGRCYLNEPHEEVIKAYILPFRFFIQDNEICSIRNITEKVLPELNQQFTNEIGEYNKVREILNQYLDSAPGIKFNFTKGEKSISFSVNRQILDTFIYGHYAHANIQNDKKEWYDFIHSHPNEGTNIIKRNHFRFEAINILLTVTNFLVILSNIIKKILNRIIQNNISQAKVFSKNSQFTKSEELYHNALYIAEKFKDKEFRANLNKEISDFYMNFNEEKARSFLKKFEDIKNSVAYFSSDFWSDEYYKQKFLLPKKFEASLKEIIKEDFSKIPIIVLPIERLDQVKRFEKIIVAKNFRLLEQNEKYVLYYELLMSKQEGTSFWSHHTFEFKKSEEYLLRFPFLDTSGILFITNSPKLFVEWYCSWLELKNLYENLYINFVLLQLYIDILIDIELEKGNYKKLHKELKNIRQSNSVTFSVEGSDNVHYHFQGLNRIITILIKISIFPKLKQAFNISDKTLLMKKREIQPFLNEKFKGLAWLSFALTTILYKIISRDNILFDSIKNHSVEQLESICQIINGKQISNEFFEKFFDFLDIFIETL